MAVLTIAIVYFIHHGGRPLRVDQPAIPKHDPAQWPRVAVIVPATGNTDEIAESLASLLGQDYPDYELIVATRDQADPASALVAQALAGHGRGRHVYSGPAVRCGQKNHNLLAGLKQISPDREILVFCDSTRLAPSHFLKELVRPVALGQALLASGYHHVIPQDDRIGTLGHAIVVMALHLSRGVDALVQPWGGSTAIGLATFEALKVEQLWAENVVDDVSLAALLKKVRVGVQATPAACLHTPLAQESIWDWNQWLTRQLMYLKYCFPGTWMALGLGLYLLNGLLLFASCQVPAAILGWTSPTAGWTSLVFLAIILALVNYGRSMHPEPGPLLPGMTASMAAIFMAGLCHFQTLLTSRIHWRGLAYNVTWTGRVTGVSEMPG
jgi:hypothetical protein